jgi:hypothetical protein
MRVTATTQTPTSAAATAATKKKPTVCGMRGSIVIISVVNVGFS